MLSWWTLTSENRICRMLSLSGAKNIYQKKKLRIDFQTRSKALRPWLVLHNVTVVSTSSRKITTWHVTILWCSPMCGTNGKRRKKDCIVKNVINFSTSPAGMINLRRSFTTYRTWKLSRLRFHVGSLLWS